MEWIYIFFFFLFHSLFCIHPNCKSSLTNLVNLFSYNFLTNMKSDLIFSYAHRSDRKENVTSNVIQDIQACDLWISLFSNCENRLRARAWHEKKKTIFLIFSQWYMPRVCNSLWTLFFNSWLNLIMNWSILIMKNEMNKLISIRIILFVILSSFLDKLPQLFISSSPIESSLFFSYCHCRMRTR